MISNSTRSFFLRVWVQLGRVGTSARSHCCHCWITIDYWLLNRIEDIDGRHHFLRRTAQRAFYWARIMSETTQRLDTQLAKMDKDTQADLCLCRSIKNEQLQCRVAAHSNDEGINRPRRKRFCRTLYMSGQLPSCQGCLAGQGLHNLTRRDMLTCPDTKTSYGRVEEERLSCHACRRPIRSCRSPLTHRPIDSSWKKHIVQPKRECWRWLDRHLIPQLDMLRIESWYVRFAHHCSARSPNLLVRLRSTSTNWSIPSITRSPAR